MASPVKPVMQLPPSRRLSILCLGLLLALAPSVRARADETSESLLKRGERYLREAQGALTRGQAKLQEQLAAKAEATLRAARRIDPADVRIWFLGCEAAAFRGDATSAAAWYDGYRARTLHRANSPDLQFLQAFIYVFAADNPDRAVAALTRMRSLDPSRRPIERDTLLYLARLKFGNALLLREQNHAAVKEFSEAARLARHRGWLRKELAALGNSGIALKLATEWQRAVVVFDDLIARDPENVLWYWHKGLALGSQHKFVEALPLYRRVIRFVESNDVPAWHLSDVEQVYMRYGNCLRQVAGQVTQNAQHHAKLLSEAETQLKRYVARQPKQARGYKWLGELYFRDMERPYDAITMYEKALALDPVCGDVPLRSLVQLYTQNPPPPGPAPEADRTAAWRTQLEAFIKQRDEGAEKRAAARKKRERESPDRTDSCD